MGVAAMCLLGDAAGIRRHEAIRMAGEAMMPLGATNAGRCATTAILAATTRESWPQLNDLGETKGPTNSGVLARSARTKDNLAGSARARNNRMNPEKHSETVGSPAPDAVFAQGLRPDLNETRKLLKPTKLDLERDFSRGGPNMRFPRNSA